MSHSPTVCCPLDCPDRCSLDVVVADGRVASITGSRLNPLTEGFICAKVRRYGERVHGPDRLLHPMIRIGAKGAGAFRRASWDEALDLVAGTLESVRREHGGEAILPFAYGGSNGLLTQGSTDERLFRALGASRLERTVCAAQTGAVAAAFYGKMASVDFRDFAQARFILVWGANPRHSNIHLMPHLKRARDQGARIALVDPRNTLGAGFVDDHLAVLPGTDAAVALAMIAHIERIGRVDRAFLEAHTTGAERLLARAREWSLERAAALAGIEAGAIARVAEAYAEAVPAVVRCGWGVERNKNGEAAVAAILALPAVAGKFGSVGGGYALSTSESYGVNSDSLAGAPEATTRLLNMSILGRILEDERPPVRVLFVYDANPAVTLPDQNRVRRGLSRQDLFTVVFDQVLTDTALFADVVLPATTFLEHTDLLTSYGTSAVMLSEPLLPPQGEALPNEEVFARLAVRLGVPPGPAGDARLEAALGAFEGRLEGDAERGPAALGAHRLAQLRRSGLLQGDFPGPRPIQFGTVFPRTPDGRGHLWPEALGPDPYRVLAHAPEPEHPFRLISPATDKMICTILGEIHREEAVLEIHPDDARALGLRDGNEVRVHNHLGEVVVPVRLTPALRTGVLCLPKGLWNRHTRNGSVGTALVPDAISPLSGGALFNDARVQVSATGR